MSRFREEFGFIPVELLYKCDGCVRAFHQRYGSVAEIVIASHIISQKNPYLLSLDNQAGGTGKQLKFAICITLAVSITTATLNMWWVFLALVPIAAAVSYYFYRRADYTLVQQRAIILAIEILAMDFARWGTFFPAARRKAEPMVHEDDDDCPKLIDLYLPPERRQDANVIDLFGPSQDAIALGEETPSSITLYRSSSMQDRTRFGLATIVINITTQKKYAVSTVEVPPTSHRWQTAVARKIIGPFANFHKPAFFLGGAPEERAADQHQRVVAIVRDIDPANWEKASLALELKLIEEETDASLAAWEAQLLCLFK